ncbi:MAG TPA: flagellar basal-body rod protein FlgF [Beijerinckiaceae bacterium]|nr:flagellar basal-body rod protein FlgF [Beijerinckiaceae bacterium]
MENIAPISLSRHIALQRAMDVIANNVANSATNGFKRRSGMFNEHVAPRARADSLRPADRAISFVIDRGSTLDLSQGAADRTGNPLDVTIKGDAFFVVRTSSGERYTRNGALSLDARGELVTSDGHAVLAEQGPLAFTAADRDIAIAADGTVSTAQGVRGRLKLAAFTRPSVLENIGGNLFSAREAPRPASAEIRLESGVLEKSNVSPVVEISRMIEVSRAYTSLAQSMQRGDDLRRSAITKLAEAA